MTLTEFLLARIAEDEACPDEGIGDERWRAEAEAKRRIVESMEGGLNMAERVERASWWQRRRLSRHTVGVSLAADVVLRHLASIYSEHPDYREEWRA